MWSWLSAMDFTQQCLSLAPVPFLATTFSGFRFIWSSVEQAQANKRQQQALIQSIAQLLYTLDGQYRVGRLMQDRTLTLLADLSRYFNRLGPWVLIRPHYADYWPKFLPLFRRRPPTHTWSFYSAKSEESLGSKATTGTLEILSPHSR